MPLGVRETMRSLPRFLQPFLTWTTGAPLWDERPTFWWTPITYTVGYVGTLLVAGLGIGVVALAMPVPVMIPLLVISWLLTASAIREFDVIIIHICVHKMMFKSPLANRALGDFLSTILWRASFDEFHRIHVTVHHRNPCTEEDEDVRFLRWTGFRPHFTQKEFHRYLAGTLFSPRVYLAVLAARIAYNFNPGLPRYRLAMSVGYLVLLGLFLWGSGWWTEWLILWAFPVLLLLPAQALLSTLSEHRWWLYRDGARLSRARLARLTFARFCGDPAPSPDTTHRAMAWVRWWSRLIFLHVPHRLFVLVGDLSQHDVHHRSARFNLVNGAYVRRDDVIAGPPNWPGYREVWGGMLSHMYAAVHLVDGPELRELPSTLPAEWAKQRETTVA